MKWIWKYNIWNIDSQWIDKLQKGKMGSASKVSTPFKFISSSSDVATGDQGLVSKYLNKNHVVLQYHPKEEEGNVSNHDAVSESGVKKITTIMKKELYFKLKTTLKGKKEDIVSFYLVFHNGDNRLTKDWKYGEGKFTGRRNMMEYEWENPPKGMLYPNGTLFD